MSDDKQKSPKYVKVEGSPEKEKQFIQQDTIDLNCQHEKPKASEGQEEQDKLATAQKKLVLIMIICLSFMVVEIIYGLMSKSIAILTDAADLLSDSAGFIINIVAISYAKKKSTNQLTFGYLKAESLGAFLSVVLIWVLYLLLIVESITVIIAGGEKMDIGVMFVLSCCAFGLNIVKICIAGGHSHGGKGHGGHGGEGHGGHGGHEDHGKNEKHGDHAHGDHKEDVGDHDDDHNEDHIHNEHLGNNEEKQEDHGDHKEHGEHGDKEEHGDHGDHDNKKSDHGKKPKVKKEAAGIRVAFINLFGDVFKSFGIVILSIILHYNPGWEIIDPIYTLVVCVLVIISTFGLIKDTFRVLIEATPSSIDIKKLRSTLESIPGVTSVRDLHVWNLADDKPALMCHIQTEDKIVNTLHRAKEICHDFDLKHTTIEVEPTSYTDDHDAQEKICKIQL